MNVRFPAFTTVLPVRHRSCVVPFASRYPISIIRPNRSSRLCDWCEVSPGLFSNSSMSSMIVFSVSVRRYAQGRPSQGFAHIAAISHILEMVASSRDMQSRLGRWSLMA